MAIKKKTKTQIKDELMDAMYDYVIATTENQPLVVILGQSGRFEELTAWINNETDKILARELSAELDKNAKISSNI
jgi:hypothetical protein